MYILYVSLYVRTYIRICNLLLVWLCTYVCAGLLLGQVIRLWGFIPFIEGQKPPPPVRVSLSVCVCVCVCVCVGVGVGVGACVRACVCSCVLTILSLPPQASEQYWSNLFSQQSMLFQHQQAYLQAQAMAQVQARAQQLIVQQQQQQQQQQQPEQSEYQFERCMYVVCTSVCCLYVVIQYSRYVCVDMQNAHTYVHVSHNFPYVEGVVTDAVFSSVWCVWVCSLFVQVLCCVNNVHLFTQSYLSVDNLYGLTTSSIHT